MTKNQIEYMKIQEDKRHNLESEANTRFQNQEVARSNLAQEELTKWRDTHTYQINELNLKEANRHNLATETNQAYSVNVQQYNAMENLKELKRANLENESIRRQINSETRRHNLESEKIGLEQSAANMIGANASMAQAGAAYANVDARLRELYSLENYRSDQVYLEQQKIDESVRHNQASELNTQAATAVQGVRNQIDLINASTNSASQAEQARHNEQSEYLTGRGQVIGLLGNTVSAAARAQMFK